MKKSTSSKCRDGLSELPDSLIHHILQFLPMRDVVRTSRLSKRWKDLWTTIPCLIFRSDTKPVSYRFRNFVNRAMILWKGTTILKFELNFTFDESCTSDLDIWLSFAIERGVEELYINLMDPVDVDTFMYGEYFAPRCLYSCSSFRELSLSGCDLKVNANVQWNQLKSLRIEGVHLSEHVINQLLLGSPQLEVLILSYVESYDNLNIESSSLKTLKIEKNLDLDAIDVDAATHTTLEIWTPNVETLEISGILYNKCLLMNVSSITSAAVHLFVPEYYECVRLFGIKLFEELLEKVTQSTHHVEKVALSNWCLKMLGEVKDKRKDMLAPLSNAKALKLYASEVNDIVGLLEIFPKLTMLVLEHNSPGVNEDINNHCFEIHWRTTEPFASKFDAENSLESKTDFLRLYLLHLTTVEITWIVLDDSIFPFIEFLLKNASRLEKMVLRVTKINLPEPLEPMCLAAQKLLSMQRSFPTVEFIIRKD